MKDINIPVRLQKSEIKWIVISFCAAFLMNVISIIVYDTSWVEIFTQILWVLLIAAGLYAISVVLRVLIYFAKRFIGR